MHIAQSGIRNFCANVTRRGVVVTNGYSIISSWGNMPQIDIFGGAIMAFEKFGRKATFDFDGKELEFIKLSDYVDPTTINELNEYPIIPVRALFVSNKGRYGASAVLVTNDVKINLPKHLTEVVGEICTDSNLVNLINKGKCGFTPYEYKDRDGNVRLSGSFVDM